MSEEECDVIYQYFGREVTSITNNDAAFPSLYADSSNRVFFFNRNLNSDYYLTPWNNKRF